MKKVIKSISLDPRILEEAIKLALIEERSLSSIISLALKDYLKASQTSTSVPTDVGSAVPSVETNSKGSNTDVKSESNSKVYSEENDDEIPF